MQDLLEEVLLLQPGWQSELSPAMDRRGVLIRHETADWLKARLPALMASVGTPIHDLAVEGRDGTGPKSELPWVRVHSASRSPSATKGWYVVYLFDAEGDAVYLSLNQGTTTWDGDDYVPQELAMLAKRVAWARELLAPRLEQHASLTDPIALHARRTKLGRGYEAGNVASIKYPLDEIPDNAHLEDDLLFLVSLLGDIYRGTEDSVVPGDVAPEVAEVVAANDAAAGKPSSGGGQGFLLSALEKLLIEQHSMDMATLHLRGAGWLSVDDVSTDLSYDLHCESPGGKLHVEVKGTTSAGEKVILTRKEVEWQREYYPHNALIVVHDIKLDRSVDPPTVAGGELVEISPWTIEDEDLTPISYFYDTKLA